MAGDPPGGRGVRLWGGRQQCEALDGLLADVRAGRSRVLVVRGEPGIGKTALLGYAAETAQDFQVVHAEGVESEMELPFAALHQLCGRMLSRPDRLPGPQRDALGVTFGLRPGSAPDRFLVGLAVLAGGFGLPGAGPLPGRIEGIFRQRLAPLPAKTQRLLLLAAAEPTGDPALLWRAADRLGIGAGAADATESGGLLVAGVRVTFRHPLVRSAIYPSASPHDSPGGAPPPPGAPRPQPDSPSPPRPPAPPAPPPP